MGRELGEFKSLSECFGINIAFSCKMAKAVGWNDGLFNYSVSGRLSPLLIPISGWSEASSSLPGMSGSNWRNLVCAVL